MHTSRRPVLAVLAAALLVATPAAAHAQLGGFIKKKIENRVADKVFGESRSRGGRAAAPKFDEDVLEITDARLDQLVRGLAAETATLERTQRAEAQVKQQGASRKAAYQAEKRAYDAKQAEYEKAMEAYQKCQLGVAGQMMRSAMSNPAAVKMAQAMMALPESEREAFQTRTEERQKKAEAAQARGDHATAAKLMSEQDADMQKTLGVSMAEMQAGGAGNAMTMKKIEDEQAKCGTEPVAPVEPEDPSAVSIDVRDSVQTAAFAASGLTDMQYTVMRERVAAWLASKEKDQELGYGFTDEELAVLEAKREALAAHKGELLAEQHPAGWHF